MTLTIIAYLSKFCIYSLLRNSGLDSKLQYLFFFETGREFKAENDPQITERNIKKLGGGLVSEVRSIPVKRVPIIQSLKREIIFVVTNDVCRPQRGTLENIPLLHLAPM